MRNRDQKYARRRLQPHATLWSARGLPAPEHGERTYGQYARNAQERALRALPGFIRLLRP